MGDIIDINIDNIIDEVTIIAEPNQYVINIIPNVGPEGPEGPQGPQGPPGSPGLYAQVLQSKPVTSGEGEDTLIGIGVGTLEVPANAFSQGDSFVAKMCGQLSCANNQIIHFRVRSNGVIIIDALQYTLATCTNKFFDLILDFTIAEIGGPGTGKLFANGVFTYNKNASNAIEGINFGLISNTVFDTTVSNELSITAEWVTSNISNTIRSQNFTLTKVY